MTVKPNLLSAFFIIKLYFFIILYQTKFENGPRENVKVESPTAIIDSKKLVICIINFENNYLERKKVTSLLGNKCQFCGSNRLLVSLGKKRDVLVVRFRFCLQARCRQCVERTVC